MRGDKECHRFKQYEVQDCRTWPVQDQHHLTRLLMPVISRLLRNVMMHSLSYGGCFLYLLLNENKAIFFEATARLL